MEHGCYGLRRTNTSVGCCHWRSAPDRPKHSTVVCKKVVASVGPRTNQAWTTLQPIVTHHHHRSNGVAPNAPAMRCLPFSHHHGFFNGAPHGTTTAAVPIGTYLDTRGLTTTCNNGRLTWKQQQHVHHLHQHICHVTIPKIWRTQLRHHQPNLGAILT